MLGWLSLAKPAIPPPFGQLRLGLLGEPRSPRLPPAPATARRRPGRRGTPEIPTPARSPAAVSPWRSLPGPHRPDAAPPRITGRRAPDVVRPRHAPRLHSGANRQRIVDFFPTTHRGPFGFPIRQRIVEISGGTRTSSRSYVSSRIPSGVYNVPRGQPSAAAPRRTSCTTNSQRDNALSVSASLADPSTTSARHWAASRPGSTSGGAATCKPAPKDSMT